MSNLIIFVIGAGVTFVVANAVAMLVWGASQERYVSGRHAGEDLLRDAEERLGDGSPTYRRGQLLEGGKARRRAIAQ